jgi:murein tripeptide amidase MpaA
VAGWWYTYPSEKYEFVSWDDENPNIWKVIKFMFQTTNQMGYNGINGGHRCRKKGLED